MKLGDNIAAVEACNVWEEVCARKSRPPRIGDIPRHNAVDEESPSASTRKLTSSPSDPAESMLEIPLVTRGNGGVFVPETSPSPKSRISLEFEPEENLRQTVVTGGGGGGSSGSSSSSSSSSSGRPAPAPPLPGTIDRDGGKSRSEGRTRVSVREIGRRADDGTELTSDARVLSWSFVAERPRGIVESERRRMVQSVPRASNRVQGVPRRPEEIHPSVAKEFETTTKFSENVTRYPSKPPRKIGLFRKDEIPGGNTEGVDDRSVIVESRWITSGGDSAANSIRCSSEPSRDDEDEDGDGDGAPFVGERHREESDPDSNLGEDTGNSIRLLPTPPKEVREVRKDSALYLEEAEGLRSFRESLESRVGRCPVPRRESSGYASNFGTFDEDGRNSADAQDFASFKERRRSLTAKTRLVSDREVMPATEVHHRKVSSSGLDMPDIEEVRDAELRESQDVAASRHNDDDDDDDDDDDERLSVSPADFPQRTDSLETIDAPPNKEKTSEASRSFAAKSLPRIPVGESSSVETKVTALLSDAPTTLSRAANRETPPSYAEVVGQSPTASGNSNKSRILSRAESFDARVTCGNLPHSLLHGPSPSGCAAGKMQRQRRRIVHQYSSPNFSSMELESILERPSDKSTENPKDSSPAERAEEGRRRFAKEDRENVGAPGGEARIARLGNNGNGTMESENNGTSNTRKFLPKSVKVYQLLSTQSEDRGDGLPNLADRRISLQIPRREEEEEEQERVLPIGVAKPEEKVLQHAESVPTLSVPGHATAGDYSKLLTPTIIGCSPMRKLSSPEEVGGLPRLTSDAGHVGVRPIYPYYPYSPYGSPQGSPRNRRRPLRESRRVSIDCKQGALQLNQYKLLDNIGQGSYGIVKLAFNEEDETHYAMKILSKKKLMKKAGIFGRMAPGRKGASNPLAKVYREIALLKKLDHPNVVKLVEVLDDPDEDNLYLVFELVQRGEVLQLPTDAPLDEDTARTNFRDIVMGVEYLHYQRIVHRDIKPSNLLVDGEGRVKIADLGVSAELRASGELLSGSAGTPAFAAPETTTPGAQYSGTLCDVWSMGVTLYSLVTGRVPWDGAGSVIGVQAAVRSEPLKFPEKPQFSEGLRDLISRMLSKDPSERITLSAIKGHEWVTLGGAETLPSEADNCRLPVTVTDEEVARVVTRVPKLDTLILIKTMLKQHSFQNPFLPRRSAKSVCGDATPTELSSAGTSESSETSKKGNGGASRANKFHRAGRCNSAPDTYEWHDRQISMESQLPPVTEASNQESEVERR